MREELPNEAIHENEDDDEDEKMREVWCQPAGGKANPAGCLFHPESETVPVRHGGLVKRTNAEHGMRSAEFRFGAGDSSKEPDLNAKIFGSIRLNRTKLD